MLPRRTVRLKCKGLEWHECCRETGAGCGDVHRRNMLRLRRLRQALRMYQADAESGELSAEFDCEVKMRQAREAHASPTPQASPPPQLPVLHAAQCRDSSSQCCRSTSARLRSLLHPISVSYRSVAWVRSPYQIVILMLAVSPPSRRDCAMARLGSHL